MTGYFEHDWLWIFLYATDYNIFEKAWCPGVRPNTENLKEDICMVNKAILYDIECKRSIMGQNKEETENRCPRISSKLFASFLNSEVIFNLHILWRASCKSIK